MSEHEELKRQFIELKREFIKLSKMNASNVRAAIQWHDYYNKTYDKLITIEVDKLPMQILYNRRLRKDNEVLAADNIKMIKAVNLFNHRYNRIDDENQKLKQELEQLKKEETK